MSAAQSNTQSNQTLDSVLSINQPLIQWLIQSGIGYSQFTHALKYHFFQAALIELEAHHLKPTDSAISLLAGINRRDICQYRKQPHSTTTMLASVPHRVIELWDKQKLPAKIPFHGEKNSFKYLVGCISTEKHPRSILNELIRLGSITKVKDDVVRHQSTINFTQTHNLESAVYQVKQHIASMLNNQESHRSPTLNELLNFKNLTEKSVLKLHQDSHVLWSEFNEKLTQHYVQYLEDDQDRRDAQFSFQLGAYAWDNLTH